MRNIFLALFILLSVNSVHALEVNLRVDGILNSNGSQMLPNDKGVLEPVNSLSAHIFVNWECFFFSCKNGTFRIRTSSNTYVIPVSDDAGDSLAIVGKNDFDKTGGVSVLSADGKYQISASATGRDLGQRYHTVVIPGVCRTETYCTAWNHTPNGNVCVAYAQRTYCDPEQYQCYLITERETTAQLDVKDALTQKNIVDVHGARRAEKSQRFMGNYFCGY